MAEYQIQWKIELEADDPIDAAMQARILMLNPHSEAVVFSVAPYSEVWAKGEAAAEYEEVDLLETKYASIIRGEGEAQ